jgi:peptidoglycan/xylan/chitin deacetylase (PgdA/CDA1 family)
VSIQRETDIMAKMGKSLVSQLYHFVAFRLKPTMQFEKSMLIISIDIDVGSRLLGLVNEGKNDANVNDHFSEYALGEIEEMALPLFADLFENVAVPATFAVRGQLLDCDSSAIELLIDSSVKHDIGSHGYSHLSFLNLSCEGADNELRAISIGMKKLGIIPRSFVFPRNGVAHLNLLENYGYKCYRSFGNFIHDSMRIEKHGALYNICPSLFLDKSIDSLFLKKILDVAIAKKAPLHFWFHLWNFGTTKESIQRSINRVILPILEYANEKRDRDVLRIETMLSAATKIESG